MERYFKICFYRNLIQLHHTHPALKNNQAGSKFEEYNLIDENTGKVYAYKRSFGASEVIVIINLAEEFSQINIEGFKINPSNYKTISNKEIAEFRLNEQIAMPPYSFLILHK